MKITVTKLHIDLGLRGSCNSDPVALALKDAGFRKVWVSPFFLELDDRKIVAPVEVLDFMQQFDNGLFAEPFEFEVGEE